ncbi:MAG: DEAD/DEAH box helicase [Phycisphaerae bacterium]|nr:DEAD/DEAH box helicase [Phycisphaerae bacterium]
MAFSKLGINEPILSAVAAEGYTIPTQIQAEAIGPILAGKDMMGCAQTGTGKTAAFALPILQRLLEHPLPKKKQSDRHVRPIRVLILSPTRELANQIGESIKVYRGESGLEYAVIYGGVRQKPQTTALHHGVDIVVATPGRLIDLMNQGHVDLHSLEVFVLDEADRMLDMGFIDDIWKILSYVPEKRQSLLFSATMPDKIRSLANAILHDPVEVHIAPEMPAADTIEQRLYFVEWAEKTALLRDMLATEEVTRALIFTRTKRQADMVTGGLKQAGVKVDVIHSDRRQKDRQRALENFRSGKVPILVASDIAARGLDVDDISHVINYELPQEPEVYIHRIGRTGRAGQRGVSASFCSFGEHLMLEEIEKILGYKIPIIEDHPYASVLAPKPKEETAPRKITGVTRNRRPGRKRKF